MHIRTLISALLALSLFFAVGCKQTTFGNDMAQTIVPIKIAFADAAWSGKKVPAGMQCKRYGGAKSMSPALTVSGLPSGTDTVIVEFNDLSYTPLSKFGGHGVISVAVPAGSTQVTVPAVPGETYQLPEGVIGVKGHRATSSKIGKGYYLPPCSGGQGNTYQAIVHAVDSKSALVIGQAEIIIGTY